MPRLSRSLLLITLVGGVVTVLLAIATNIAANLLPDVWQEAPWLVWAALAVLALALSGLGVWQSVFQAHDTVAPSRGLRAVPEQLPATISDFTGRGTELAKLHAALTPVRGSPANATMRIAVITGKPGIGKSALAVRAARDLIRYFPDGQLYANLRGSSRQRLAGTEVLGQFLRALGVADKDVPTSQEEQEYRYRTLVSQRRLLVLLDNAADSTQVRPLLPGSPTCAVLITSRHSLSDLEGASLHSLELLDPEAAIELLGKLAGRERVGAESEAAELIVRRCGYLPLAVRMAGAKLADRNEWSLADLARSLADTRGRLAKLGGDVGVRASFALSYTELEAMPARTFRLLSLLDGPDFTPGVAAALTDSAQEEAEQHLEDLTDAQLLEAPAGGRYRFHDLMRLFARERLTDEESEDGQRAALRRALEWYLAVVRRAVRFLQPTGLRDPHDSGGDSSSSFDTRAQALDWLELERPNFVAAVRQASGRCWDDLTWQLAEAPWDFFSLRKYLSDWEETAELGLQAARRMQDRTAEGRMLHNLGLLLLDQRDFGRARDRLEECLAAFREVGDRLDEVDDRPRKVDVQTREGRALGTLGTAHRRQQQLEAAIDRYEQSLDIRRAVGDRLGEAQALEAMGSTYRQQQRFDEAIAHLNDALTRYEKLRDRRGEARVLGILGSVQLEQRQFTSARTALEQSLAISTEMDDRYIRGRSLANLARAHLGQSHRKDARACLQQSLDVFQELGDRYAMGQVLKNYGLVVELTQSHRAARRYWEEAIDVLDPVDRQEADIIRDWIENPGQQKPWLSEREI